MQQLLEELSQCCDLDDMLIDKYFKDCESCGRKKLGIINEMKLKCVIFKCYSSEMLIALNILHEVVPTWYSFHS